VVSQGPGRRRLIAALTGGLVAELVNKLVPLIVLRFVVGRIGVEEFGRAQFAYWLIDGAIALVTFGYAHVAAVEIGRHRDDPLAIGSIIGEVVSLKLLHAFAAAVAVTAAVLAYPPWQGYAGLTFALLFVLFTTALDLSFVHVGTSRMAALSGIIIAVKVVSLAAVLVFVRGPEDVLAFTLLYFGANGVIGIANFLFNVRRWPPPRPTLAALEARFVATIPYALTAVLLMALDRWDVFVVENLLGARGAGLYGGPVRIAQALSNVVTAMSLVFLAESVSARGKADRAQHVRLGLWAMWALTFPMAAGAPFVGDGILGLVLGPEFVGQGEVFAVLVAALCAQALVQAYGLQVLMVEGRTMALNAALAAGVVVGLAVSLACRDRLGMLGVAYGALASRLTAGLALFVFASRHLDRYPLSEGLLTAGPAVAMALVLALGRIDSLWVALALGGATYGALFLLSNRRRLMVALREVRARG
jgi:O-antigen/teichoic acid export membrane protein